MKDVKKAIAVSSTVIMIIGPGAVLANPFTISCEEVPSKESYFLLVQNQPVEGNPKHVSTIIEKSKANAMRYPDLESFHNAVVTYSYEDNVMYSIYSAPGKITDIRFQIGESIVSIAAGDTKNWLIEHALAGDRPHLLIKPLHSELSTNLTVLTDKRTYWFYLKSWKTTFMPGAQFHYPQDELRKTRLVAQQSIHQTKFQVEDLDFDYVVESKCSNAACLKPKSVFADKMNGRLHLVMPEEIQHGSLPVLFALDPEGNAAMINYRFVDGKQFILDTLHEMLMLEYGGGENRRVYIFKSGTKPRSKNAVSTFLEWVSKMVEPIGSGSVKTESNNNFPDNEKDMGR